MSIIIQDFKRELSVWQQQIEVEANHEIVPTVLGIPVSVFFFHYKDGTSTAYRDKLERAELPSYYLKLALIKGLSQKIRSDVELAVKSIKETTSKVIAGEVNLNAVLLKDIRNDILEIWPGYLYGYNIPRFEEKGIFKPSTEIEKENLSIAKEIRRVSEGIYDYVENAIKKSLESSFEESGIPLERFHSLTTEEIFGAIRGERLVDASPEYIIDQAGLHAMSFPEYLRNNDFLIYAEDNLASKASVKGVVACSGGLEKVRGRVRMVFKNELKNVDISSDEVLVCLSTSPDYLPLMKKAAGIVTDEGGLLSHAAIVSRELNKPCIVQTKSATKSFANGDQIELNLANGTVDKI